MKKPALLRAAIAALLPDLARDPDRLAMWVERGRVRATHSRQRGFSWEYDLTMVVENYRHDPALIFFIVVDWLRLQQPDLLAANGPGFAFEVDVIDEKSFDVQIVLPLVERVSAAPVDGGWQLEVLDEAVPLFPDAEPLRTPDGPITAIWVRGGGDLFQVAPDPDAP